MFIYVLLYRAQRNEVTTTEIRQTHFLKLIPIGLQSVNMVLLNQNETFSNQSNKKVSIVYI